MKKIFTIFAAACLFASCNLDQFPPSDIAADSYIKDDASLNNVVIGMYNGMYDVLNNEWAVTELRTNNVRMRESGSSANDTKLIEELDQATISTSNNFLDDYWKGCYKTIKRANTVLENLDKAKVEANRNQYEGEARFLRSLVYFNLVRLWGPVFIMKSSEDYADARNLQRSPVEDVYKLIIADLETIINGELLPEKVDASLSGRAEMDAARFLLAKVGMTIYQPGESGYSYSRELLAQVVKNRYKGSLVPYDRVFAVDNEMNEEIIFAIRYKAGNLGIGAPFSTLYGPLNNGGAVVVGSPKHYNYPSDNLIAEYEAGDLRKDVTLKESYINAVGEVVDNPVQGRFCNKFIDYTMVTANDAETDFPIMRVADAMLLLAEAISEVSGPDDEALALINAVRGRAGLAPRTLDELNSRYAFRQALRHERRIELALENHHWYDLLRWGIATSTVNNFLATEPLYSSYPHPVNPIEDWQCTLPIPTSVRNINPTVAQNPGY